MIHATCCVCSIIFIQLNQIIYSLVATEFPLQIKWKPSWKNNVALNINYLSQNLRTDCSISKSYALWYNNIWFNLVWPNTVLLKRLRQRTSLPQYTDFTQKWKYNCCLQGLYINFDFWDWSEAVCISKAAKQHVRAKIFSASRVQLHSASNKLPPSPLTQTHTHTFTYTLCMNSQCWSFNTMRLSCKWEIL